MSLTKATYSMIKGGAVNVFDFMTEAEIAEVTSGSTPTTDVTAKIDLAVSQVNALGGGQLILPPGKYCGRLRITTSNIEVVAYGAEVGFQNVDATLEVYPPNPGNTIPFNYSFVGGINAGVPNNVSPNATFYNINTVTQGNDTISVLGSAAGLAAGDWCMLMSGQNPNSSVNNHIPQTHQFVEIRSVAGLNVTLQQVPDASFTSAAYAPYLVKWTFLQNVTIRGLTINNYAGGGAAYLYFFSGTNNVLMEDVVMNPATGLGIFSTCQNGTFRNVTVVSGQGGFSNGRMCDNITMDNCRVDLTSSEGFNQNYFYFCEENTKKLNIHNCKGLGGGVYIVMGTAYTNVTISDSLFEVFSGVHLGLALSSNILGSCLISNTVFAVKDGQEPAPFPPATPSVCVAVSSTMEVQFSNCKLIQLGTGACYVAFSGSVSAYFANTYVNGAIPLGSYYTGLINDVDNEYQSWFDKIIIPTGGDIQFTTNPVLILSGTGNPNGVITANPGSLYLNISGGAGTSLYVKESGTSNTGWVGK